VTPHLTVTRMFAIAVLTTVVLGSTACSPAPPSEAAPRVTLAPLLIEPGTETTTQPKPTSRPAAEPYYANCAAVRSAGKAPLHRGEAGYRSALDRDNDGLACE
jgi:hypothetical protein